MKQYDLDPAEKDLSYNPWDKTKYNLPVVKENKAYSQKGSIMDLFNEIREKAQNLRKEYPDDEVLTGAARTHAPHLLDDLYHMLQKMSTAMTLSDTKMYEEAEARYKRIFTELDEKKLTHFAAYKRDNLNYQRGCEGTLVILDQHIETHEKAIEEAKEIIRDHKEQLKSIREERDTAYSELLKWKADLEKVEADKSLIRGKKFDQLNYKI